MALDTNERSVFSGRPDEFYKFSIVGGETYRYTPMRLPLTYQGFEYQAKAIQRGNYAFKKEMTSQDTLSIEVQSDLEILNNFKIIVPRRTMLVTIYRRHRGDSDLDILPVFFGRVRGVSWEGAKATIECDSMNVMAKRGGLTANFQVGCNYFLYDEGCGLQRGDWKVTGPLVSVVNGVKISSPVFATKPDGWFKYGYLEAGDGAYMIIDHKGSEVTLLNGLEGVAVGAAISAYAGCDRTLTTCWGRFDNGLNYLGFPWSPADNIFTRGF